MDNWASIKYMGFWDVPLVFLTQYQGQAFLFDCPFREDLDDYAESYRVFLMPELKDQELPKDWTTLHTKAIRFLGEVPVAHVVFDPSGRQSIETGVLDEITSRKVAG